MPQNDPWANAKEVGASTAAPAAAGADPWAGAKEVGVPAQSSAQPDNLSVGDTLLREGKAAAGAVPAMISGAYHAFKDPVTPEEYQTAAGYRTANTGKGRGSLAIWRMFGKPIADAADFYSKAAVGQQPLSLEDVLSVAPEALGGAGASMLLGKAGQAVTDTGAAALTEKAPVGATAQEQFTAVRPKPSLTNPDAGPNIGPGAKAATRSQAAFTARPANNLAAALEMGGRAPKGVNTYEDVTNGGYADDFRKEAANQGLKESDLEGRDGYTKTRGVTQAVRGNYDNQYSTMVGQVKDAPVNPQTTQTALSSMDKILHDASLDADLRATNDYQALLRLRDRVASADTIGKLDEYRQTLNRMSSRLAGKTGEQQYQSPLFQQGLDDAANGIRDALYPELGRYYGMDEPAVRALQQAHGRAIKADNLMEQTHSYLSSRASEEAAGPGVLQRIRGLGYRATLGSPKHAAAGIIEKLSPASELDLFNTRIARTIQGAKPGQYTAVPWLNRPLMLPSGQGSLNGFVNGTQPTSPDMITPSEPGAPQGGIENLMTRAQRKGLLLPPPERVTELPSGMEPWQEPSQPQTGHTNEIASNTGQSFPAALANIIKMKVQHPDGTVGTIPVADWPAAQRQGYKRID